MAVWLRPQYLHTDPGGYWSGETRTLVESTIDPSGDDLAWADDVDTTGHLTRAWRTADTSEDYSTALLARFDPFTPPPGEVAIEARVHLRSSQPAGGAAWLEMAVYLNAFDLSIADFGTWHGAGEDPLPTDGFAWVRHTLPGDYLETAEESGLAIRITGWNQDAGASEFQVYVSELRLGGATRRPRAYNRINQRGSDGYGITGGRRILQTRTIQSSNRATGIR
jgi:hypothetical protein